MRDLFLPVSFLTSFCNSLTSIGIIDVHVVRLRVLPSYHRIYLSYMAFALSTYPFLIFLFPGLRSDMISDVTNLRSDSVIVILLIG